MLLTEHQRDSLAELMNIAFSRTAASLSELTGRRVLLDPPTVEICAIDDLGSVLPPFVGRDIASIHQIFSGALAGDALLILDDVGALALANLLMDSPIQSERLDSTVREALVEIGNILLNAWLGTFGNILHTHISFSVPRIKVETLQDLLLTLTIGSDELRYALVVYTNFRVRMSSVSGYIVMVLGVTSLEKLISATEQWANDAIAGIGPHG